MAEIREMVARGDYVPTATDAPEFDGDDAFWEMMERGVLANSAAKVELQVDAVTVAYFKKTGPDYLERMAKVLDEAAKKAS